MPRGTENLGVTPTTDTGFELRLSKASVGRLSLYLRSVESELAEGRKTISSASLGKALGVNDAQVRKDLAGLGSLGSPGVGYDCEKLESAIRKALGIDRERRAALVGVGNLARALLGYQGFVQRGFRIVALFDSDPSKIGSSIAGVNIHSPKQLAEVIEREEIELGILTVPANSSQKVADALISAGIRGILNFAPGFVLVPAHIPLVSVDVTVQLEQLSFLIQQQSLEKDEQPDTR